MLERQTGRRNNSLLGTRHGIPKRAFWLAAIASLLATACAAEDAEPETESATELEQSDDSGDDVEDNTVDDDEPTEAEGFPDRPIEVIVPYSAGGGTDTVARHFAAVAGSYLDVPIRIVTMPGGGGSIGTLQVAESEPDGYTLVFGATGSNLTTPIFDDVGYEWDDFQPVAQMTELGAVVVVPAESEYETLGQLMEASENSPGGMTYGTSGAASSTHICFRRLEDAAGVEWVHVPFDGGAESLVAVLGGTVDFTMAGEGTAQENVDAGLLRPLAFTGTERSENFPDVPTFEEAGYDVSCAAFRGLLAPAGTPSVVMDELAGLTRAVFEDEDFQTVIGAFEPTLYRGPDEFLSLIQSEAEAFEALSDEFS